MRASIRAEKPESRRDLQGTNLLKSVYVTFSTGARSGTIQMFTAEEKEKLLK
jgi:hypothetical protein